MNRNRLGAGILFVSVFTFFLLTSAEAAKKPKAQSDEPQILSLASDDLDFIKNLVFTVLPKTVKEEGMEEKETVQSIQATRSQEVGKNLILTLRFKIDMNDGDLTGRSMLNATRDLYKTFFAQEKLEQYDVISIIGIIPMTNKYNKIEDVHAMAAVLARETADKINWQGLTRKGFIKIMLDDGILNIHQAFIPQG